MPANSKGLFLCHTLQIFQWVMHVLDSVMWTPLEGNRCSRDPSLSCSKEWEMLNTYFCFLMIYCFYKFYSFYYFNNNSRLKIKQMYVLVIFDFSWPQGGRNFHINFCLLRGLNLLKSGIHRTLRNKKRQPQTLLN